MGAGSGDESGWGDICQWQQGQYYQAVEVAKWAIAVQFEVAFWAGYFTGVQSRWHPFGEWELGQDG